MDPQSPQPEILEDCCLLELRSKEASAKNSLFQEGLVNPHTFSYLEKLNDNLAKQFYDMYFDVLAPRMFSLIGEPLHNESLYHKEVMDYILKLVKNMINYVGACKVLNEVDKMLQSNDKGDMKSLKSAFELLKIEHQNLYEKIQTYFKLRQQLRISENVEDQLQFGWSINVNPEAGSSVLRDMAEYRRKMQIAMDKLMASKKGDMKGNKSEQVAGEGSSGPQGSSRT